MDIYGRVEASIILEFCRKVTTTVMTDITANAKDRMHKTIFTIVDISKIKSSFLLYSALAGACI